MATVSSIVSDIVTLTPSGKTESEIDKRNILLRFAFTQNMTIRARNISKKPALPFAS